MSEVPLYKILKAVGRCMPSCRVEGSGRGAWGAWCSGAGSRWRMRVEGAQAAPDIRRSARSTLCALFQGSG